MTPLLLFPLGLAALVALAVPLAIHLHRRTEEIPVDFAALRWLDPLPRPRRKLRFDELLLLAVRLLLVALIALLLAQPAILGVEDRTRNVLVAPGADVRAAREIAGPDADARWIAPGFPALDTEPPTRDALSSLIRQYDAELPPEASLTIVVPPLLDGVDAEPLRLTRAVRWKIAGDRSEAERPTPLPAPALVVRHAGQGAEAVRYFRAAAAAWGAQDGFDAGSGSDLPNPDRVLVWLKPGPVPAAVTDWVARGGTALLADAARVAMPGDAHSEWRDAGGSVLVEGAAVGDGRLLRFTRPLTPAAMPDLVDPDFAARLRDLLAPPPPPPMRVAAERFAPTAGVRAYPLPPYPLTQWLAVLIAAVFLAERWLATRRRRLVA
ncbi:BatA domain-containing protein [Sphingomonas sp. ST-64]|uniref:BatA domain-containing protein n=1 Tax=Sphingomonas plantiphila TaxID=3163295 RepID=A0ABW8YNN3_9SPHN